MKTENADLVLRYTGESRSNDARSGFSCMEAATAGPRADDSNNST